MPGTSGSRRLGARATPTSGVARRRRVAEGASQASVGVASKYDAWPASGLAIRVLLTPSCVVPSRSSPLFNSKFEKFKDIKLIHLI